MTRDEIMRIAVITRCEDGDTKEWRDASMLRSAVPAFRCHCDDLFCRMQRVIDLADEWEAEDVSLER